MLAEIESVRGKRTSSTDRIGARIQIVGKSTSEEFAQEVEKLRKTVGIEDSIKEYGIAENIWKEKLDTITQNAMDDPCTGCNPRKPTFEEIKKIFECCYNGEKVDF